MADQLILFGFCDSVYTRAVRIALAEMSLTANYVEVNPFAAPADAQLAEVSPLGRVPVLQHGSFVLTETVAILRYLADLSPRRDLVPRDAQAAARMAQVMGIVDAYLYWPMVRGAYSHGIYRPARGEASDPDRVRTGLRDSAAPLHLLNDIASEGLILAPDRHSLADFHLAPMVAAFAELDQARAVLMQYPALTKWWAHWQARPSLQAFPPPL